MRVEVLSVENIENYVVKNKNKGLTIKLRKC